MGVRPEDPQISGNAIGKPGIDHSPLQDTQSRYSYPCQKSLSLPLLPRDHRPLDKALEGLSVDLLINPEEFGTLMGATLS